MHAPVIGGPVALVIIAVGGVAYLVARRATRPEAFILLYAGALSLALTALLAYLVIGAATTGGRQRGGLIGEAIIVGCFAIALVVATTRMAMRYRAGRRPR